ncbi:hypothetical protein V6N13_127644 [Hibiscus sabdariffa]
MGFCMAAELSSSLVGKTGATLNYFGVLLNTWMLWNGKRLTSVIAQSGELGQPLGWGATSPIRPSFQVGWVPLPAATARLMLMEPL